MTRHFPRERIKNEISFDVSVYFEDSCDFKSKGFIVIIEIIFFYFLLLKADKYLYSDNSRLIKTLNTYEVNVRKTY